MEAAGIEPASEINSLITPTCFFPDLNLASVVAQGTGYRFGQSGDLNPTLRTRAGSSLRGMPIPPALRHRPGRLWRLILVRQPLRKN